MAQNRQVILAKYPKGMPTEANFSVREVSKPSINEKQVLIRSLYLTVDPYMRGRMDENCAFMPPFEINKPLSGDVVGKIVESKNPSYKVGDIVVGFLEWGDYIAANVEELRKLNPAQAPVSTALGAFGLPGMTAYFGLLENGFPKAGETVLISGAAGAVGYLVGQIAKIKGCRVVGIAGSDEKTRFLTKEIGFDAAINYKKSNLTEELKKACPKGVDVYFDNVGGPITDQAIRLINKNARIVICGQISMYNLEPGADVGPRPYWNLLIHTATVKGFVSGDYEDRFSEGIEQMSKWYREGKIKNKESIVEGLENAPRAFLGLFKGENIGKQVVKIAD